MSQPSVDSPTQTSDLPSRARIVIVGGGVIGASIAYHLTKMGISDVVLLERQRLTSGTTWHAAGLIASGGTADETSSWIARYTRDLYANLEAETGVSTGFLACGYLQLATTERRRESYRRETAFLSSFGVEKHEITGAECGVLNPLLKTDDILSGFITPDEGRANPVDVTMSLARGARDGGARIIEMTEVTDFTQTGGRVTGVVTDRGTIECDQVVLAAGLWGRQLAAKAGVLVPLQACEHYYLLTEPMEGVHQGLPIVEDTERYGYYREEGGGMLVGLFEPVAAAWSLDSIPKDSAFLTLPPDWDRLTPFLEDAFVRFPTLADAGIKTLFCGPESFTPDLGPMLGESPELDGFFVACGMNSVGILTGGAVGKIMAEWMVEGLPPVDVSHMHVDRAQPFEVTRRFRSERAVESLGALLNDGGWPNYAPKTGRGVRRSILHDRLAADGATFMPSGGWEYVEFFGEPGTTPDNPWLYGRHNGFERTRIEHEATREAVTAFDLTSMSKFLVQGPDAERVLNQVCAADVAVAPGRIVYTQWLDERGRIHADLTVTRLADDQFLIVTADLTHRRIPSWIRRATPDGAFLTVTDVTSGSVILSVQGPRSRELLSRLTPADLSNDAFPYLTAQHIELGYAPILALRVTYVGELGWELHIPTEFAPAVYDQLREVGQDLGYRNAGMAALSSLRLEKAYRDFGHDIDNEDNPYEVGLGFAVALDKPDGFTGRDALVAFRAQGPVTRRLAQFLLDDPAYDLMGNEPIYLDDKLVGYMRAGAFGYTLGASVGLGMIESWAGLDAAAVTGGHFEVDVAGTRVGATATLRPRYDPDRTRPNA